METNSPESIYRRRIDACRTRIRRFRRQETWLAALKLAAVAAGILLLARLANGVTPLRVAALAGTVILFGVAAAIHEGVIKRRVFQETLKAVNEMEIEALRGEFPEKDAGEEFASVDHAYASDLDIFGKRGLFHYLNRTATGLGRTQLAGWLRTFPEQSAAADLGKRQAAVAELAGKIDLRQDIRAHGRLIEASLKTMEAFRGLLDEPPLVSRSKLFVGFIHVFPLVTAGGIVLAFHGLPWPIALAPVLFQGLANRLTAPARRRIHALLSRQTKVLSAYSRIAAAIESEEFAGEELAERRAALVARGRPASHHIRALAAIQGWFDLRHSREVHLLFNNLLFWDLHCINRIERWKRSVGPGVPRWFEAMGQVDALSSLANAAFNNPDWAMPEIRASEFALEAEAIGHPLIPEAERVTNDVAVRERRRLWIVTGPNMAGKTTLLKTLGVNIVLALAGGPVCARRFVVSALNVYTSMDVTDSLEKRVSLFYAELLRLKTITDAIARGEPVFFLIDEMLKGTNEADRHTGAVALVERLIEEAARGIVSTHDLDLAGLAEAHPDRIANYHFYGRVEGDVLRFDYVLREGVCRDANALELMKRVGLI